MILPIPPQTQKLLTLKKLHQILLIPIYIKPIPNHIPLPNIYILLQINFLPILITILNTKQPKKLPKILLTPPTLHTKLRLTSTQPHIPKCIPIHLKHSPNPLPNYHIIIQKQQPLNTTQISKHPPIS